MSLREFCTSQILVILVVLSFTARSQTNFDSLENVFKSSRLTVQEELAILNDLVLIDDTQKQLEYSNDLIRTAEKVDSVIHLYNGYLARASAYQLTGEYANALKDYLAAYELASRSDSLKNQNRLLQGIADVYSEQGDRENAILYYRRAIEALTLLNDSIGIASAELNLSDEYLKNNWPDSAIYYAQKSGDVFARTDYVAAIALSIGNMGIAYAQKDITDSAKVLLNEAIAILEKNEMFFALPDYYASLSDVYLNENNWDKALSYAMSGLKVAENEGMKGAISNACLQISQLHQQAGNYDESLKYYQQYHSYRDSVNNLEMVTQMANLRTNHEIAQREVRIRNLEQKSISERKYSIALVIISVMLFLILVGLFRRNQFINRTKSIIEKEKNRSDQLLLNILPEETAVELKEHGKVKAQHYDSVSVMFADFAGFTRISEDLHPEVVVRSVDYYFSGFDKIMEKHGLEKIKTMGDAYMCVGGLHGDTRQHAIRLVKAAQEITSFVEQAKSADDDNIAHFQIRIGINTGPVIAGVVGTKKFAYDIWGDTVNIAARMESNSQAGRINVSENTYHQIKEEFTCTFRGEIDVKNKGMMRMYFVESEVLEEQPESVKT